MRSSTKLFIYSALILIVGGIRAYAPVTLGLPFDSSSVVFFVIIAIILCIVAAIKRSNDD